jgi:hypothetical protein
LDVFRHFRKSRESLPIQLYGKLPLAKDYLRVGASKGSGRALREWLDQSYSSNSTRTGARDFPWPMRFIVFADDGDAALGSGWSSSDHGGERTFPFVVFVERRAKLLAAAVEDEMQGLDQLWREVEEFYAARVGFKNGESLLVAARGRSIVPDLAPSPRLERVDYASWLDALWPDQGQEGLVSTLASIARLGADGYSGPLRVPLVADLPALPQVSGWWTSLRGLGTWTPDRPPTVFFPQSVDLGEEPHYATFSRGRLRTEDARWLESARGQANQGRGDYAKGGPVHMRDGAVRENLPSLADSMRGAVASARARR